MRRKVAIYVSTEYDEDKFIVWPQSQCEDFAREKGWEVTNVYTDVGVDDTNLKTKRRGLKQMLRDAKTSEWDAVLVPQLTALTVSTYRFWEVYDKLADSRVNIISRVEGIEYKGEAGRIAATIQVTQAWGEETVAEQNERRYKS